MTPDIRVDWRGDGFSVLSNDSFLVDTSGWSVAAGINAAGTSITRGTGDGVLGGVATNCYATLVTTGTLTSGCKYVLTGTFSTGRTYRFSVWLKSVSGTTAARIRIGSLGTGADRATSTMTLTTSWVRYTVDWTPSGNRTDAQITIENNAASVMTARVCLAEVYEAIDDIGAAGANEVDALTITRGANFDGSAESPGSFSIGVTNIAQRYSPDNASGALFGLLTTKRPVWVRAIENGLVYGLAYGQLRRLVPNPEERTAELVCEDPLYQLSITEVSLAASSTTSIAGLRAAVLTAAGFTASQQVLATGSPETHIPITGADQQRALDVLADCNAATGSIHYVRPHPCPSVLFEYRTIDRTMLQTAASLETFDDATSPGIVGLSGYDVTDEALINNQRVAVTTRSIQPSAEVWTSAEVPFAVAAGATRTIWASFADPVFSQVLTSSATNAPTITLTPYMQSAKIVITAGGTASVVSVLSIAGQAATVYGQGSESSTTGAADHRGSEISSSFIESRGVADGLADYVIARYGTEKPRPGVTLQNKQPSEVTRDVGDTITLNFGLLSVSGKRFVIRSLTTRVTDKALVWQTDYALEAAMADTELFTIGGSASEGVGGTGVLAY